MAATKYNWNLRLGTQNFTVCVDTDKHYGWFEHDVLGDNCGGGLWFDKELMLEDYDGVYDLPSEVKNVLVMFHMCEKDF
jgi:hypothetical protein